MEYGLTAAYGNFTPTNTIPGGTSTISNTITGLEPGTRYHYRVDVLGSNDGTTTNFVQGYDASFVTADIPRWIGSASITATGQLNLQFRGGPAANYTILTTTNPVLPLFQWQSLGAPTILSNNLYQFTDPNATNTQQYYLLLSH